MSTDCPTCGRPDINEWLLHHDKPAVHDVSGSWFTDGLTTFSVNGFIDALVVKAKRTGAEANDLVVVVHPAVYARMRKLDLVDVSADGKSEFFLKHHQLIMDKSLTQKEPVCATRIYDGWPSHPDSKLIAVYITREYR